MGNGKTADPKVSWVNAAIWRHGGWSVVLVIVPFVDREKAILAVAEQLHYRLQPNLRRGGGSLYLVSTGTHVCLVQGTSSDDARARVKSLWGQETKRPVQPFTIRLAPYTQRSSPLLVAANHWRCRWCGCRDLTFPAGNDQECPSCYHHSNNAIRHAPAKVDTSTAEEKGWPPIEIDPSLKGIGDNRDQYY